MLNRSTRRRAISLVMGLAAGSSIAATSVLAAAPMLSTVEPASLVRQVAAEPVSEPLLVREQVPSAQFAALAAAGQGRSTARLGGWDMALGAGALAAVLAAGLAGRRRKASA